MKIIQWAFPFLPTQGGREVMIDNLSRELQILGHEVMVVTDTDGSEKLSLPYQVLRLNALNPAESIQAIRDFAPEIIHVHNFLDNSVVMLRSLNLDSKIILTLHNEHKSSPDRTAQARFDWARQSVSEIVAISDFVKLSIEQSGDFEGVPVSRIWNGTEMVIEPKPLGQDILFMGRIQPEKGLGFLLASMFLLVQKHPRARLQIVGDGPFRKTFENLARDLCLEKNVRFLGWQTGQNLERFITDARMIVVPSAWKEPFGLVAIEAMMNQRPVIVTDRGGLPELVEAGKNGFVVQPGDILELAARMSQLVEDSQLAAKMGAAGRTRALEDFTLNSTALSYLKVYEA